MTSYTRPGPQSSLFRTIITEINNETVVWPDLGIMVIEAKLSFRTPSVSSLRTLQMSPGVVHHVIIKDEYVSDIQLSK